MLDLSNFWGILRNSTKQNGTGCF